MQLPIGKVGPRELERLVLPYIRLRDRRVLVGPRAGLDAAVIDIGRRVLVLSCDPITGAYRDIGWLVVNINANDIATMGATPRWFVATLFAPEGCGTAVIKRLTKQVQAACDELGVSLVGGHTEVTQGLHRVIISGTMVGEAPKQRFITSAGAEPGDRIIFTKSAAIEGTAILAADRERELTKALGHPLVARAKRLMRQISIVKEALTAVRVGVTAMHDPTEGGVAGGLHELADASRVGFDVDGSKIPVAQETRAICAHFGIDPLQLISSGSLLITTKPGRARTVLNALKRAKIQATEIGGIVSNRRIRRVSGRPIKFPEQDHLWRVFTR